MNYDILLKLTRDVPDGLDRKQAKGIITKEIREQITERDNKTCQICGMHSEYGNRKWGIPGQNHIHHIIPNGPADVDNLITLCEHCHHAVHLILFSDAKWKFPYVMRGY